MCFLSLISHYSTFDISHIFNYSEFHMAKMLNTVSTRNTKLVKIAIEPIARAFATPCNVKWNERINIETQYPSLFSEYTHRGRMLVRINLLWAHGNEEKEAKEVEQEQLESEQGLIQKDQNNWILPP